MTPAEMRAALDTLGISAEWLGRACGRSGPTGRAWVNGRREIPPAVTRWLDRRAAAMRADPPPLLLPARARPEKG